MEFSKQPQVFTVTNDEDGHITRWFAHWAAQFRPNSMHTLEKRGTNYYHIPSRKISQNYAPPRQDFHLTSQWAFVLAALHRLRYTMYLVLHTDTKRNTPRSVFFFRETPFIGN